MFNNPRSGSLAAFILLGLVSIPAGATVYTVMHNAPAVQTEAAQVMAASAVEQEAVPNRDWSKGAPDSRKVSDSAAESVQETAQEQAPDLASQQQTADPVFAVSENETETAAVAAASQETPAPEQTAEPWQTAEVQEYAAIPEYTEPVYQEPVCEETAYTEPVYEQTVSETWQDPYYPAYEETYSEEYVELSQEAYTQSYEPVYEETYYAQEYAVDPSDSNEYDDETYGSDEAYVYGESCGYDEEYGYEDAYTEPYAEEVYVEPYIEETYEEPYVEETYSEETYEEPYVYEEAYTDPYADLNSRIADAALGLVGVTDGLQCTEVATLSLANAGVEDAMDLWPDEFQPVYGEYTNTPQAGNLIYYDNGGRGVDHIAIYVGDGQAVHGNYVIDGEGYTVIAPVQYSEDVTPQYIQIQR